MGRHPRWLRDPVEWVTVVMPTQGLPVDREPLHRALDDALSDGRPDDWVGMVESFDEQADRVEIFCMGPDADAMWAIVAPLLPPAPGTATFSYRDGRADRVVELSE